jgi:hypothetical protein
MLHRGVAEALGAGGRAIAAIADWQRVEGVVAPAFRRLDVPPPYYSQLENGTRALPEELAPRFAGAAARCAGGTRVSGIHPFAAYREGDESGAGRGRSAGTCRFGRTAGGGDAGGGAITHRIDRDSMPMAERERAQKHRPAAAVDWRLLTMLTREQSPVQRT